MAVTHTFVTVTTADAEAALHTARTPRCALASMTHWNATGWHSAMFEPSITMKSALARPARRE